MLLAYAWTLVGTTALCYNCSDCQAAFDESGAEVISLANDVAANGSCLVLDSPGTFECGGHLIQGNGTGIGVEIRSNVTLRNCRLSDFNFSVLLNPGNRSHLDSLEVFHSVYSVYLNRTWNATVENLTAWGNVYGPELHAGGNNTFLNITAFENDFHGLWLYGQDTYTAGNRMEEVVVHDNAVGVAFNRVQNSTVRDVEAWNCTDGLYLLVSSQVNVSLVHAFDNRNNGVIIHKAGSNNLSDLTLENNGIGLFIFRPSAKANRVTNVQTRDNLEAGIRIENASKNTIKDWNSENDYVGLVFGKAASQNEVEGAIRGAEKGVISFSGPNSFSGTIRESQLAADLKAPLNLTGEVLQGPQGILVESNGSNVSVSFSQVLLPYSLAPSPEVCQNSLEGDVEGKPIFFSNTSTEVSGDFGQVLLCNASGSNLSVNSTAPVFLFFSENVSLKVNATGSPGVVIYASPGWNLSSSSLQGDRGILPMDASCPAEISSTTVRGGNLLFLNSSQDDLEAGEVVICGENLSFDNLTITGVGSGGINVLDSRNLSFTNLTIQESNFGLFLVDTTNYTVKNATIEAEVPFRLKGDPGICDGNLTDVKASDGRAVILATDDEVPGAGDYYEIVFCPDTTVDLTLDGANAKYLFVPYLLLVEGADIVIQNAEYDSVVVSAPFNVLEFRDVNASRMEIEGGGSESFLLRLVNVTVETDGTYALRAESSGLEVQDSKFRGGQRGSLIKDSDYVWLYNSTFSGSDAGLLLVEVSWANVTRSVIKGVRSALYLQTAAEKGPNTIYDNIFNSTKRPVYLAGGEEFEGDWNVTKTLGPSIVGTVWIGGNWYEDYSPTCDDLNKDGFCDEEYKITAHGGNTDYLPLSSVRPPFWPPPIVVNQTLPCVSGVGNYPNISAALDAAASGDFIWVCPGLYEESVHVSDKANLEIYGENATVLNPVDDVFQIARAPNLSLHGFQVLSDYTGGYSSSKAGLKISDSKNLSIYDMVITNASVGVWLYNGVEDSSFENITIRAYSYCFVLDNYGLPSVNNTLVGVIAEAPNSSTAQGCLYIFDSYNNTVRNSSFSAPTRSVYIQAWGGPASGNRFENVNVSRGVQLDPGLYGQFRETIWANYFENVLVDGKPLEVLQNQTDVEVSLAGYGQTIVYNLSRATLTNAEGPVSIFFSENFTVEDASIGRGFMGIEMWNVTGWGRILSSVIQNVDLDAIAVVKTSGDTDFLLEMVNTVIQNPGLSEWYRESGYGSGRGIIAHVSSVRVNLTNVEITDTPHEAIRVYAGDLTGVRVQTDEPGKVYVRGTDLNGTIYTSYGRWQFRDLQRLYGVGESPVAAPLQLGRVNLSGNSACLLVDGSDYEGLQVVDSNGNPVEFSSTTHGVCFEPPADGAYFVVAEGLREEPSERRPLTLTADVQTEGILLTATSRGRPVEGVRITWTSEYGFGTVGTTPSNGSLFFVPPRAGNYTFNARASGYESAQITVEWIPSQPPQEGGNQTASQQPPEEEQPQPPQQGGEQPGNQTNGTTILPPNYTPPHFPPYQPPQEQPGEEEQPPEQPSSPCPLGFLLPILLWKTKDWV